MTVSQFKEFLVNQGFEFDSLSQEWQFYLTGSAAEIVKFTGAGWIYKTHNRTRFGSNLNALKQILAEAY